SLAGTNDTGARCAPTCAAAAPKGYAGSWTVCSKTCTPGSCESDPREEKKAHARLKRATCPECRGFLRETRPQRRRWLERSILGGCVLGVVRGQKKRRPNGRDLAASCGLHGTSMALRILPFCFLFAFGSASCTTTDTADSAAPTFAGTQSSTQQSPNE